MKDLKIKQVSLAELLPLLSWHLIWKNGIKENEFSAVYDKGEEILYINDSVPEEDVNRFVEYASFTGPYINNDDAEGGLAGVGNYILKKYGSDTYMNLMDAYQSRQKAMRLLAAQERVKRVMPLIDTIRMDEEAGGRFNEYLAYCVSMAGMETKRKTAENMVSYSTECVFWLGYLTGAETISDKTSYDQMRHEMRCSGIDERDIEMAINKIKQLRAESA